MSDQKRTATFSQAIRSGAGYRVEIPEILLEIERYGIAINRPFTMQFDTLTGVIEVSQDRSSD